MSILVLGGTRLVGRHIASALLDAGHDVALFNRGITNPDIFSNAEQLIGDRSNNLSAIEGRSWDAVIDVSGHIPEHVRLTTELLRHTTDFYLFISTMLVYAKPFAKGVDETHPLETPLYEDTQGQNYGAQKLGAEEIVREAFPDRNLALRLGPVSGPHDWGATRYYINRVAQGGDVLVPDTLDAPFQFVDGRDVGSFVAHAVENDITGAMNLAGYRQTWGTWLETCTQVTGAAITPIAVTDETLLQDYASEHNLRLPGFYPPSTFGAFMSLDSARAIEHGASFRPVETTIRDVLAWQEADRDAPAPLISLAPDHEQSIIKKWQS